MALQHRWAAAVQFLMRCFDDGGVIVSGVINAVAGEKIQDRAIAGGAQRFAAALDIVDIHIQQLQQPGPLRVHVRGVGAVTRSGLLDRDIHSTHAGFSSLKTTPASWPGTCPRITNWSCCERLLVS
jgi:hypothetical protein